MQLTCSQVISLLSFYEEGKLTDALKYSVEEHLKKCPKCREIYMRSQKTVNNIFDTYNTKQYESFKQNLSAYVDSELDEDESLRIKKTAISNPLARKDLEDMYAFKRMLHNSFERTKNEWKNDYSKLIINKLHHEDYRDNSFMKLAAAFTVLVGVIAAGFISLYF